MLVKFKFPKPFYKTDLSSSFTTAAGSINLK